jgi:hypothetical protein
VSTCAEVRQLHDPSPGIAAEPQRFLIAEHASSCERCRRELDSRSPRNYGQLSQSIPKDLPPDVRARLTTTLDKLAQT